jgi:hypothetical protein
MAISKRLRFEVFKRDGFRCAYCGNSPEQCVLEVDHIEPRAKGGDDDTDNLITACFNCNRGKADVPLSATPQALADKAAMVAEREEQIREYREVIDAARQRQMKDVWLVAEPFMEMFRLDGMRRDHLASIKMFLNKLDFYNVADAMEIACDRLPDSDGADVFRYFAGVCWTKIKESGGPDGAHPYDQT